MKAKLQILCSMAAFGTIGIFVKHIPLASGELALYRAVIAAFAIGVWLIVTGQPIKLTGLGRELPLLLLSGAAVGVNWILFFEAYRYTTVALATLSYYFAPVIVTIASSIIYRERLTARQVFCFVMCTLGLGLVIGADGGGEGRGLLGIFFGLGAALFYAAVVLLNKGLTRMPGVNRTFLQFLAAIAVLIPYVFMTGGFHLNRLTATGAANLLVVGVFHTGVCYCLYFSSLRYVKGQEASILSYMDPLVAVLVSVAVLHESISLFQAAGGAMILGFAILNEWKQKVDSGIQRDLEQADKEKECSNPL